MTELRVALAITTPLHDLYWSYSALISQYGFDWPWGVEDAPHSSYANTLCAELVDVDRA